MLTRVCAESLESLAARTTDVYDQLLLREIPNRDAEFNCGRSYLDSDRPDLAEEVFRRCIEAGYKPVDSRFRLAQSLAGQHRHTEAKREIIMVLQDDPEHEEAIEWYHEFQEHVNRGTSGDERTDRQRGDDERRRSRAEHSRGAATCARCCFACAEGKIAIYGLIGLAAFGTLIYAWMRSRRTQP